MTVVVIAIMVVMVVVMIITAIAGVIAFLITARVGPTISISISILITKSPVVSAIRVLIVAAMRGPEAMVIIEISRTVVQPILVSVLLRHSLRIMPTSVSIIVPIEKPVSTVALVRMPVCGLR